MQYVRTDATKALITVTTKELLHATFSSNLDIIWDSRKDENGASSTLIGGFFDDINPILREDEKDITALFKSGKTFILIPSAMSIIDSCDYAEIIVTRSNGTSFVIRDADIEY